MNFFKDEKGEIVIVQRPNIPLWFAFFFFILKSLPNFFLNDTGTYGLIISLIYWSYLEIKYGANGFRKLLGTIVLIFQIINIYKFLMY